MLPLNSWLIDWCIAVLQAEYIVSRLQDTAQNLQRTIEQFDLLFNAEITEEQAVRHGLFIDHPSMTVDWDSFTSDEYIVIYSFCISSIHNVSKVELHKKYEFLAVKTLFHRRIDSKHEIESAKIDD